LKVKKGECIKIATSDLKLGNGFWKIEDKQLQLLYKNFDDSEPEYEFKTRKFNLL